MTNEYGYNNVEFQCFGWSPLSRSSLPPAETFGLDYESARECTPQWYGVSIGDGNYGVSHMFPNFYVRTNDPFRLAEIACVSSLDKEYQEWGMSTVEVDGEREYTISATIYDPPDEDSDDDTDYESIAKDNGYVVIEVNRGSEIGYSWSGPFEENEEPDGKASGSMLTTEEEAWRACCEENELVDTDNEISWSSVNGAWLIFEVFPVDDMPACLLLSRTSNQTFGVEYHPYGRPAYTSIEDAFSKEDLKLAD